MNAQANMLSIKATERELDQAYLELRRLLQVGRVHEAVKQATRLANQDENRLWNYLRAYAAVEINYRDAMSSLLALKVLSEDWQAENSPVFIAHAITTLIGAPKGDSIAKFLP